MSTLQTRTQLILPDDGGPGGDDTVNVTTQIADSIDYLSNAVGIFHVANVAALPVTNLFTGRLAQTDDTGAIYQYIVGTGWVFYRDTKWQTAWKPDVRSTLGSVTLGTGGARDARYFRVGEKLRYCARLYSGTTGVNFGNGGITFSIPYTHAAGTPMVSWGGGTVNARGEDFMVTTRIDPGDTKCSLWALWLDAASMPARARNEPVRSADNPSNAVGTGIPRFAGVYSWEAGAPGYLNVDIEYWFNIASPIASTP